METSYRLSLLGADIDAVTPDQVMTFVTERVAAHGRAIVANHNLHSLYLFHKSADMRAFYAEADLIEIDSIPLIGWGKLLGLPLSRAHRSTYLDFRDQFWGLAATNGWRVAHVGGRPEDNDASHAAILARHPGVHLDVFSGFFDTKGISNTALLDQLKAARPDVLLVGMGMPRQELWILNNYYRLPECVVLPVGGAFDYEAGITYTPPRWTGQLGIEWLVRLVHDPKRLFQRYLMEPWALIPAAIGDVVKRLSRKTADAPRKPIRNLTPPWRRRQAFSAVSVSDLADTLAEKSRLETERAADTDRLAS